jgi:hypothetical protein
MRLLVGIVISPVEHEVARDAQARANGNPDDGQQGEHERAGEKEVCHKCTQAAPVGGCVAVNCDIFVPASPATYTP